MGKKFEIKDGDISDGYHTFNEIYQHRKLLYVLLCLAHAKQCVWADHKEWDSIVLVWNSDAGQVSYHVSYDMKELFEGKIKEVPFGEHGWDGHTSGVVVDRLLKLAKGKCKWVSFCSK